MESADNAPALPAGGALSTNGATIFADGATLVARPTPLRAALTGSAADVRIDASALAGVRVNDGDAYRGAVCDVEHSDGTLVVRFVPGDTAGPQQLDELVQALRSGRIPDSTSASGGAGAGDGDGASAGIPGFDFVGFDVETANQNWGSICQIGLVRVIDGVEVERASWLCTPPEGMDQFDPSNVAIHGISAEDVAGQPSVAQRIDQLVDFVGDLPLVAHNAQFDATALRDACRAVGRDIPTVMFACTLAQSRAAKLDVANHRLPTLAEKFGVGLDNHHDACEDAAACAGIMVGLARDAGHEGSLMSYVHSTGFSMGVIAPERVTPVLRDRSGAARALQAELAHGGVVTPRGSNQHSLAADGSPTTAADSSRPGARTAPSGEQERSARGPAPWQSVATPDTVPEPNPDADPNAPLYGHNVTLTGEFEPFDKGQLWAGIADQGGQVGKNATKKTTILVTGEWATTTTKEKRARELMDKGQEIEIWPAQRLFDALGLEQPPF